MLAAGLLIVPSASAQQVYGADATPSSEQVLPEIIPSRSLATSNTARTASPKSGPLSHLDDALQDLAALSQGNARLGAATVMVDVVAEAGANVGTLEAALIGLGFEPTGRAGAVVSGRLPVSAIEDAAALRGLRSAMAPRYVIHRADGTSAVSPLLRVGAVEGESSAALRADDARALFDVDGSGVCIGIISDSFDTLGGAAAGVASGDLPEGINVLDEFDGTGIDEGRGMMELAFDVAPGVDFAFHTAFEGYASFAGGVVDLFDAGCEVVVDDIGISTDPFFQDGAISQAIDYIVSEGGAYFSSAGNSSNGSYEADFVDSGELGLFGGALHDFDPSTGVDAFQDITVPPFGIVRFSFQYDEPSILAGVEVSEFPAFYGGAAGQTPTSDYDVWLLSAPTFAGLPLLDFSINENPTFGAPQEFIEYQNLTGAEQTVYVAVEKFSGEDRRIKYINFGGDDVLLANAEYNEGGSSTAFGHTTAAGTFATGAAPWFNTDELNPFVAANPDIFGAAAVQGFTSFGGLDIRLDTDGNRLAAPEDRMKPDATATDTDNNTFFGTDVSPFISADTNPAPNFSGTSAAAPNAAAVAALAVEAAGGTLAPEVIYSAFETTAADILNAGPFGFPFNLGAGPGFDDQSGNGLIRADLALIEAAAEACSPSQPLFFSDFDPNGDDPTLGEFATISNGGGDVVNLSGCTFAVFNPFTLRVEYALPTDGVTTPSLDRVLATMNGDQDLAPDVLADRFGTFALLATDVEAGDRVFDVLPDLVAGVAYFARGRIAVSLRGGRSTREAGDVFLAAMEEVRAASVAEDGPVDLTLSATPNPVRDALTVRFGTAEPTDVEAVVYDALGRRVAVLAEGAFDTGRHALPLDASALPSGVYVVRVTVGAEVQTARVTVVR